MAALEGVGEMEIRLDRIVDEPFEWQESRTIAVEALEREQLVGLSRVSWSGQVAPMTSGLLFSALLDYEQQLCCPRCLSPSWMPIKADLELLIVRGSEEPMLGEVELEESDLGVLYVEGEVLDTEPLLLEQIQLNIPMRFLCKEECKGLCPVCGVDRNKVSCDCATDNTDTRWSALAALRDQLEE